MDCTDDKKQILREVLSWLVDKGYPAKIREKQCLIYMKTPGPTRPLEVYIRLIDRLNLQITSPYIPLPDGDPEKVLQWENCVFSRPGYTLEENDSGLWVAVCLPFQLTHGRVGDSSRLFQMIGDLKAKSEYNYQSDLQHARDLGLTFRT